MRDGKGVGRRDPLELDEVVIAAISGQQRSSVLEVLALRLALARAPEGLSKIGIHSRMLLVNDCCDSTVTTHMDLRNAA